jgi:8-oxoguanine DNA glycosylase-like protein
VHKDPAPPGPIAGYACLPGGYDYHDRAAPGQEPWSRLHGFGPAFFTKFLYFSTPGALILDNQLANAVLHWMTQTAWTIGVKPELLELTLFQP